MILTFVCLNQLLLDTSGPYNAISMVHLVEICHNFDSCEIVNDPKSYTNNVPK
ncbi:hypothetical protein Hanom_Chr10g00921641 [Helianthus anomalus]